ncbi:protein unc-93 homolog A-like [Amphiura filiformis]|uniref:protein unc-93 homolog A-like n=1 Tax=Amphiura filiformis TaxID=82378 RepID=UPI003B21DE2B
MTDAEMNSRPNGHYPSDGNVSFGNSKTKLANGTDPAHTKPSRVEDDWSSGKIIRNLICVSAAFLFLFTAFQGISNLQSSINCDQGLGVASLAIIYATLIFSAIFVPSFVIRHLGLKWTLVGSMCCYTLYMIANLYPSWGTVIPASILVGLGAAPLWSAKCTYLTTIGMRYAVIKRETRDAIVNRFFGVFFLFFQSSQVLGNLISSLVFSQDIKNSTGSGDDGVFKCGAKDCYTDTGSTEENGTNYCELNKPEAHLTNILIGIYTACGMAAMLTVAFFLVPVKPSEENQSSNTMELFGATMKLMMDKRLLMMIPITIYSGLEQAFIQGDYTKSYITCTIGVAWVGYIMICFGVTDALCSFLSGRVEKYTGRIPLFALGALVHVALVIVMVVWEPSAGQKPVFFVLAAFWGLGDAIWQTQLNAFYGVLFPFVQEAAFSNYRLWESVGFCFAFAYSNFLCVWIKLTILISMLESE